MENVPECKTNQERAKLPPHNKIALPMKVIVREFMEADREVLRDLFVASRDASFPWAPPGAHKLEDFDMCTEGERILVALASSNPVGFASIWEADSFLHNLFVHPLFLTLGVGRALLAHCEKYFSSVPTLKCVKLNDRARRFYESQGWRERVEADGPEGPYLLMERAGPSISMRLP